MAVVLAQGSMRRSEQELRSCTPNEEAAGDRAKSAGHLVAPHGRSFVCIDEFGKGTEDAHATALCAALLHRMDQVRCPLHVQHICLMCGSRVSDGPHTLRSSCVTSCITSQTSMGLSKESEQNQQLSTSTRAMCQYMICQWCL
jgi:hypothetical protein